VLSIGFFPPDCRGVQAVLLTEVSGQQPAIVTLDACNAGIMKLNLAKRFPMDKVPLKKCA
jgi:hypothetical protein